MCEPVTLAAVTGAMTVGSTVMSMMSAAGKARQAKTTAATNSYRAEQAGADAFQRADLTEQREYAKATGTIAAERSQLANGGTDVNAGSGEAIQEDTRLLSSMDRDVIANKAAREAYGSREKAQGDQQESTYSQMSAHNEELGDLFGGIGKLAGLAGNQLGGMTGGGGGLPPPTPFSGYGGGGDTRPDEGD